MADQEDDLKNKRVTENTLFVGNLTNVVTEYMILKAFQPHGQIKHIEVMKHTFGPKRGEPRGFCFVEFSKRSEAETAMREMNGKYISGRRLNVNFSLQKDTDDFAPVTPSTSAKPEAEAAKKAAPVSDEDKIEQLQRRLLELESKPLDADLDELQQRTRGHRLSSLMRRDDFDRGRGRGRGRGGFDRHRPYGR